MLIELLTFYHYACQYVADFKEQCKKYIRSYIGPAPIDYCLLENGDIIPTSIRRHDIHDQTALLFTHATNEITEYISKANHTKLSRLPWLSIVYKNAYSTSDLSDWVSEIRVVRPPSLQQLIRLGLLLQNEYLEEKNATVSVITRTGEEEMYEYQGVCTLVKVD